MSRSARMVRPGLLSSRAAFRLAVVAAILLVVLLVTSGTSWPSAMLIRAVFEAGGNSAVKEMEPFVTDTPLTEQLDVQYGDDGVDTQLDAYTPASATKPLPTVVWVHGGAWIAGSKENVAPYLRILAAHGYTTIGVNYSRGPEATYPTAVFQLNDALGYINSHAAELNVDPTQLVLAGDSAGAQLASQLAVLTDNADYANLLGITPALSANQLRGMILNCGVYDMTSMAELDGIFAWGLQVSLWAYTGTKKWSSTSVGSTMSTIDFVTADLPPTYISGGNGDELTWLESVPMSNALKARGVDVTELFWPADHEPQLPHEYQFHLKLPDAQAALAQTVSWLAAHTTQPQE
ncbi:esterase [Subtercola boreus]|uniref:Esterase n=1 Tax=Subtercola boreus TaxID=120213 RepID=A0A3E0VBW5_9MICO|nr:alpha/beta hydrolase [Subtercola boreus]RFA07189.1 esterase [Subtercola boreus]